jgi:hypothetical protein
MAARKLRITHQEDVRRKIQVSHIINRLHRHIEGELELTPTQISAAKLLLDKAISNAPTEVSGPDGGPLSQAITVEFVKSAVS